MGRLNSIGFSCWLAVFLFLAPGTHALAQEECIPQSPNIVAWWPFDETTGTDSVDIAGTNDGLHVGGPSPTPGLVDGSLRFDGADDFVVVPDSDLWAFGPDEFTIEFWANFDFPANGNLHHPGDVFISNDEGPFVINKWFFALYGGGLQFLHSQTVDATELFSPLAPFAPVVGQWHHLAIRRSGTVYEIFVDGDLRASGANTANMSNPDSVLTIGRALEPFGGFMDGRLDEMTIYNRALTADEIEAVFDAGSAGKCKGPMIDTAPEFAIILGKVHSQEFEVDAGQEPFFWSVIAGELPAGMDLGEDGVFSGTPTELGTSVFTVEAIDGNGDTVEKTLTVGVVLVLPPPDIRIRKVGTLAVPGRVLDYFITVENVGGETSFDIPVVEILETSQVSFVSVNPSAEIDFDEIVASSIIPWVIPTLSPGQIELLTYQVRLDPTVPFGTPVSGQACSNVEVGDKIAVCLAQLGLTVGGCAVCVPICGAIAPACGTIIACLPEITFCTGCLIGGPGPDGIPIGCLPSAVGVIGCFIDVSKDCSEDKQQASGPKDPNEKYVLSNTFIQPTERLVYPVHFENVGDVEALDVFVTDVLDINLDDTTLETLSQGASYDPSARTLRWELLGRNLQPGETGNVLFSIKPVPGLPSGTEIRNEAEIRFEVFDPLVTPEVVNVIDTTPPECAMDALAPTLATADFAISWTGTDEVGEIKGQSVFVSVDGGTFTPFLEDTLETVAVFPGEDGKTYGFLCVAADTAGNIEPQEDVAEVVTQVVVDGDGDGVPDLLDQCPNSSAKATIVIETCDSGVDNALLDDPVGCTITDEILKLAEGAKSHGQFVSRATKFLTGLQKTGVLEPNVKNAINVCAAQSSLP